MVVGSPAVAREIPVVRGWPVLGSLVAFARDPLGFTERIARLGDLVGFSIVEHRLVQVGHPDLVEEVLVARARTMHKDAIYANVRPLLGNGLVTSEGDEWRRHRKLAAPSFSKKHVDGYAEAFVRCTTEWVDRLRPGPVDAHAEFVRLAERIVLETLFGTDLVVDTARVPKAIETVMAGFVYDVQGPGRLLPGRLRTGPRRRADEAVRELDRVIFELIAARRAAGLKGDLLSRLIEARDEDGGLTDRELRDEAVTAFVAGHETTALALTNTIVLLGEHPACADRVRAEVDEVLGDRLPTAADFSALRYTTAAIQEAMRLIPPVWAFGREPQEDLVLGGVPIAKGTQILVPQWVIHRDPRWFERPLEYRPERWLDGLAERLPRMAYLPFGGGPRICIGNHFAMLEAVLVLATMSRRVAMTFRGPRPEMIPSITLRPAGPVEAEVALR